MDDLPGRPAAAGAGRSAVPWSPPRSTTRSRHRSTPWRSPLVDLPGGARLAIHPTPALVAIDVDAGGATAGQRGKAASHLALNRAVLPALAQQIRLRNLSGAILVDLAGLPPRRRASLGPALAAALADDPLRPRLLGFTALGLAEIVRPRIHPPLHELLAGPHAAGLAALRRIAAEIAATPHRMPGAACLPHDHRRAAGGPGGTAGPCAPRRACPDHPFGPNTARHRMDHRG